MVNPVGLFVMAAVCAGLWYLILNPKARRGLHEGRRFYTRLNRSQKSFHESVGLAVLLLFNVPLTALALYLFKLLIAEYWVRYFG